MISHMVDVIHRDKPVIPPHPLTLPRVDWVVGDRAYCYKDYHAREFGTIVATFPNLDGWPHVVFQPDGVNAEPFCGYDYEFSPA